MKSTIGGAVLLPIPLINPKYTILGRYTLKNDKITRGTLCTRDNDIIIKAHTYTYMYIPI